MAKKKNPVLERQLKARASLWPDVTDNMLWGGDNAKGYSQVPRVMPLMMSIMDDLSGKGFPVGQTYLEMWCRLREEGFLALNKPEEMAFHTGFSGQRAVRTWKDRVKRLADLGFIDVKPGPSGELSFAIFFNPYHVIKREYLKGNVQEAKWQALVMQALDIKALDFDEIDDEGNLKGPEGKSSEES
jgi:hypothetical protein